MRKIRFSAENVDSGKQESLIASLEIFVILIIDDSIDAFLLKLGNEFSVVQVVAPTEEHQVLRLDEVNQRPVFDNVLCVSVDSLQSDTLREIDRHFYGVVSRIFEFLPLIGQSLSEEQNRVSALLVLQPECKPNEIQESEAFKVTWNRCPDESRRT